MKSSVENDELCKDLPEMALSVVIDTVIQALRALKRQLTINSVAYFMLCIQYCENY